MVLWSSGQRAIVGEPEVLTVEAARVGEVVAGVGGDAREPPRVLPHQLGVGVHRELGGSRRPRVSDHETEQGPAAPGRSKRVKPHPLENFVAGPTHWSSSPNQTPSTSFSGGAHTPPISPVMCQPLA